MKLLSKLAALARTFVPRRKSHTGVHTLPKSPELPPQSAIPASQAIQEGDAQAPIEALEQVRVADLLRDQLDANKEKGE